MAVWHMIDRPVPLLAEGLEGVHMNVRPHLTSDGNCPVRRAAVDDMDIIAPGAGAEALGDVRLLVVGQNHHGNVAPAAPAGDEARTCFSLTSFPGSGAGEG